MLLLLIIFFIGNRSQNPYLYFMFFFMSKLVFSIVLAIKSLQNHRIYQNYYYQCLYLCYLQLSKIQKMDQNLKLHIYQ
jgi:hypothetical protein